MIHRYLGIDPGSQVTGWGIIEEQSGVLKLIDCGAIKPPKSDYNTRLRLIYKELYSIMDSFKPQETAIEQMFLAKNALVALKLGQARGIVMALCMQFNIPFYDYLPTHVKQSVVGVGRAEKSQVAFMVHSILGVQLSKPLDTTDALAVAICHANNKRLIEKTKISSF